MHNITIQDLLSLLKSQQVEEISFTIKFNNTTNNTEVSTTVEQHEPYIPAIPQEMKIGEF